VIDLGDEFIATVEEERLLAIPSRLPRQTTALILATSSLPLLKRKRLVALPPRQPELTAGLILATSSLPPLSSSG